MQQIHGTTIKEIKNIHFKTFKNISYHFEENTDSIWTQKNDVALCIKTADCMPVFIVAEKLISAIHMGWRGARDRIVEKFIKCILLNKNIKSESIKIICGPHIRKCCYSVGKELIEEFEKNNYKIENLFLIRRKKIFLNLEEALYQQAESCGISNENITIMKLCTHCLNSIFYSFRRGDSGRNISLIIKGNRI
jgi:YfiH family protein